MRIRNTGRRHGMPRLIAAATVAAALAVAAPVTAFADDAAAPAGETPAAEAPAAQAPGAEAPADGTTAAEPPAVETAVVETVAVDAPAAEPPAAAAPAADAASAEAPLAETPVAAPAGISPESPGAAATASDPSVTEAGALADDAPVEAEDEPVNHAPVAVDDYYQASQDQPLVVSFPGPKGNDYDPDGDWFQIQNRTEPSSGEIVSADAHGPFEFHPAPGFVGTVTWEYWLNDDKGGVSEHATVTVEVLPAGVPAHLPPNTAADEYSYAINTPLYIAAPGVLANDDLHGQAATISVEYVPPTLGSGAVDLEQDGSFLVTPQPGSGGFVWFSYRVCTEGGCSVAEVRLNQTGPGESPSGPSGPGDENHAPSAVDDEYTVVTGTTLNLVAPGVLVNDSDQDGDALTLVGGTSPQHADNFGTWSNGRIEYRPSVGFIGVDQFDYVVGDGKGGTDTATITINVVAPDVPPVLQDDSYQVVKDTTLNVAAAGVLGNDDLGQGQWSAVMTDTTEPAHGTLQWMPDGSFAYTPDAGFTGVDTFDYFVTWRTERFSATVTLTVTEPPQQPEEPGDPEDPANPGGSNQTPATPREERLASTGSDPSVTVVSGALLLALGIGLTVARRQRRA